MSAARAAAVAGVLCGARAELGLGPLLGVGHAHGGDHHHHHHEHAAVTSEEGSSGFGGSTVERTFGKYKTIPIGEDQLLAAGWTKHHPTVCDPHFGFAWTEDPSGATKQKPVKLYTTAAGQPAGIGVIYKGYGNKAIPDEQRKWTTEKPLVGPAVSDELVHVDVAFRSGEILCSGKKSDASIGDVLIVNPAGGDNARKLPLTEEGVRSEGWHRGSCFDSMGWHWFLDTALGNGRLSYKPENLFPVVTMYHGGVINAIFFASQVGQVSIPFIINNEWEPKALSSSEMCKNTCDTDCDFSGTPGGVWSTLHVFFRDHTEVTCDAALQCGITWPFRGNCCEADFFV